MALKIHAFLEECSSYHFHAACLYWFCKNCIFSTGLGKSSYRMLVRRSFDFGYLLLTSSSQHGLRQPCPREWLQCWGCSLCLPRARWWGAALVGRMLAESAGLCSTFCHGDFPSLSFCWLICNPGCACHLSNARFLLCLSSGCQSVCL